MHADSIGITEWYLDTHACTITRRPGCLQEGKMMLDLETFPGQVPYRALLPRDLDNFLVPVCLSSTHVAWGTIRLEPTWMNLAESAAYAVVQARRHRQTPAEIDTDQLLRTLATKRVMISFFNDVDLGGAAPWNPAAQYFGTRGFFHDYDVRAEEPLKAATAKLWVRALHRTGRSQTSPTDLARLIAIAETSPETATSPGTTAADFTNLSGLDAADTAPDEVLSRGAALELLWEKIQTR
jgi:hypothetical protein